MSTGWTRIRKGEDRPLFAHLRKTNRRAAHESAIFRGIGQIPARVTVDPDPDDDTKEALIQLGHKLLRAQETERTWIARELHDDIVQRISLLAFELDKWDVDVLESPTELRSHVRLVFQRLSGIAKDTQALSHRLHSSKLEYLGLSVAARSFCNEVSERHNVEINFSDKDVPTVLSTEISLCLFRVLQEALQNAVKHSGARHFKVDLHGTSDAIRLCVSDSGIGFDVAAAFACRGLGLVSMQERLHLISGELIVQSEPGGGAKVYARVPLRDSKGS
jgi:signal transduction histidine kinase